MDIKSKLRYVISLYPWHAESEIIFSDESFLSCSKHSIPRMIDVMAFQSLIYHHQAEPLIGTKVHQVSWFGVQFESGANCHCCLLKRGVKTNQTLFGNCS